VKEIMSVPNPIVRYFIVCEDVIAAGTNSQRLSVVNVMSSIRSLTVPAYPIVFPQVCGFALYTESRSAGDGRVEILAEDGALLYRTPRHALPFGQDTLEVHGALFRIRDFPVPAAGLYWVQFWYNDDMLVQQPLLMR